MELADDWWSEKGWADKPEETPELHPGEPTSGCFRTCYLCARPVAAMPEGAVHRIKKAVDREQGRIRFVITVCSNCYSLVWGT